MGNSASQHAGTIPLTQMGGELHWAHYAIQGKRDSMEDAFVAESVGPDALFGVFDGHYGKRAALYSSDHLPKVVEGFLERNDSSVAESLKNSFLSFDQQLLAKSRAENWHDGTTALVALLSMTPAVEGDESRVTITRPTSAGQRRNQAARRESSESTSSVDSDTSASSMDDVLVTEDGSQNLTVYIANSGDCRAISVYGDGRVFQLSTDHTPLLPYERWRIFKAGGNIKLGRIEGKLSVSRGFGDRQFKEPLGLVSALPEVVSCLVTQNLRFIILACDGVWGWLNNTQVAKFVAKSLREGQKPETVVKDLVKYAFDQGSTDNISVVLLYFTLQNNQHHTKITTLSASHTSSMHFESSTPNTVSSLSSEEARGKNSPVPHNALNLSKSVPNKRRGSHSKKSAQTSPRPLAMSDDVLGLEVKATRTSMDAPLKSMAHAKSEELFAPSSPSFNRVPLSGSLKAKKFNFSAAAAQAKWTWSFDCVDRRADRALVIKTHVPTGEYSLLDLAEHESTAGSEVEALVLDSRPSVEAPRNGSIRRPSSHPQSHPRDVDNSSSVSGTSGDEKNDEHDSDSDSNDSNASTQSSEIIEPKRTSSIRIPAPRHARMPSNDSNGSKGSKQRLGRHVSVPDDDEDAVAYKGAAKSMSPAKPTMSRPPVRSASKPLAHKPNYGESDSESDQEAQLRRHSFDDTPVRKAHSSHSKSSSRTGSSHSHKRRSDARRNGRDSQGSPKEDADADAIKSVPSDSPTAKHTPTKKKRYDALIEEEMRHEEAVIQRRAASFDSHREDKKKSRK